jgi:uncharacterized protein with von Willebrand factor type A (vWA) domain
MPGEADSSTYVSVGVQVSAQSLSDALDQLAAAVQEELSEPEASKRRAAKRGVRHERLDGLVTAVAAHRRELVRSGVLPRPTSGAVRRLMGCGPR